MRPADRVTWTRAVIGTACGVVVVVGVAGPAPLRSWSLVGLASLTLLLDLVDGPVARATGTASEEGARLDMEVDAAVLVVLSAAVSTFLGWWVLLIGAMRYLYLAASFALPVLRTPVPPSRFRRAVAGTEGVALVVALAPVVPTPLATTVVLGALLVLVLSFVQQTFAVVDVVRPPAGRLRRTTRVVATVLSVAVVWFALVAPHRVNDLTPGAFVRIPLEGLGTVGLALVLPARVRRVVAVVLGLSVGVLAVIKFFDLGFRAVFDRPFDLLNDWAYLSPAVGVLSDSFGHTGAVMIVVGAAIAALAVLVVVPVCTLRLTTVVARHRRGSVRVVTGLSVVWVLAAVTGVEFAPDNGVASAGAVDLVYDQVQQVRFDIKDRGVFAREIAQDPFADADGSDLLTGLRGKDVLLVFVESYGRVAVQGTSYAPGIEAVLDDGTDRLRAAGYDSRSAFLTSPTFGAASWLAHSTLQSGLWVNSQQRYDQLFDHDRLTLTGAFGRAGWRTVFDDPAITDGWPEGADFYQYDHLYDSRNVGYEGPKFGYAPVPDQYTLDALRRLELGQADRPPLMAEVDLVSSHHPWAPLPRVLPWDKLGDGSVYDGMPEQGKTAEEVLGDTDAVRAAYGQSIQYSLESLISFLETYPDPDLVVVLLGDHQPHSYVTGSDPGRDVPITVIAPDPGVMKQISGWRWQPGMHPDPDAPVWPMNSFRDRFLTAFGSAPPSR